MNCVLKRSLFLPGKSDDSLYKDFRDISTTMSHSLPYENVHPVGELKLLQTKVVVLSTLIIKLFVSLLKCDYDKC